MCLQPIHEYRRLAEKPLTRVSKEAPNPREIQLAKILEWVETGSVSMATVESNLGLSSTEVETIKSGFLEFAFQELSGRGVSGVRGTDPTIVKGMFKNLSKDDFSALLDRRDDYIAEAINDSDQLAKRLGQFDLRYESGGDNQRYIQTLQLRQLGFKFR
jgi:hypothetical protein